MRGYQLADLSGCSRGAVSEANTGKDAPRDEVARKWAKILRIPADQMPDWLNAAAIQRAQRGDIGGRRGEARLAQRIEHLERMERNLAAVAASLVAAFVKNDDQRNALMDLIERDAAMLQTEDAVRTAVAAALTGQPS